MSKMVAARYTQGIGLRIEEVPIPEIGRGELLLRVQSASICGTDLKMIRYGHRKLQEGQSITLGHEFVGTIERVGNDVRGWTEGQRVGVAPNIGCGSCRLCARGLPNMCPDYEAYGITFDGAHAEYVRIPSASINQGSVVKLPDGLASLEGSLAEPLSCALNGARVAQIGLGDTVLVYGAGPMGLLNMMLARHSGASRVIAVDLNDDRLALAERVGATQTINSSNQSVPDWVRQNLPEHGVDVVMIAVPVPALQQEAIGLLLPYGRLCLFASWARDSGAVSLNTNDIHYKNLMVSGMTGGSPRDYRDALALISEGVINVLATVSDVYQLRDLETAYDQAMDKRGMKIAFSADQHEFNHLMRDDLNSQSSQVPEVVIRMQDESDLFHRKEQIR